MRRGQCRGVAGEVGVCHGSKGEGGVAGEGVCFVGSVAKWQASASVLWEC